MGYLATGRNDGVDPTRLFLWIALLVQPFFWWLSMPGPQLRDAASLHGGVICCAWSVLTLLACPALVVWWSGDSWERLGLGLGDWKWGLTVVAICTPGMLIGTWVGSYDAAVQQYYPIPGAENLSDAQARTIWWVAYGLFYVSFEFFYRGFMLRGLGSFGWKLSIGLQTACCVLIHIGKPNAEVLASVFASLVFGWVAYRTRSIWYGFLIHFAIGIVNDLAAMHHAFDN